MKAAELASNMEELSDFKRSLEAVPQFLFSHGEELLLAEGEVEPLSGKQAEPEALLASADSLLQTSGPNALLYGALPFNPSDAVQLFVSERCSQPKAWPFETLADSYIAPSGDARAPQTREAELFKQAVQKAVSAMQAGEFSKVVLSRQLQTKAPTPALDLLLSRIRQQNPKGALFSMQLPGSQPHAFVGLTPEVLVEKRGSEFFCAPLAGTIARSADPKEDAARAEGLLRSPKDLGEHRIVVEQIRDALAPHVSDLSFSPSPILEKTQTLWHLKTEFRATLKNPEQNALALALLLHPTPAVCGLPTHTARQFILENENHQRGLFTGAVGYMHKNGDGRFMVTIRCADLFDQNATIYAGAGIVADSSPESELLETTSKMLTMQRALALHLQEA